MTVSAATQAFKDFARWRKQQQFDCDDVRIKAGLVGADLHLLTTAVGQSPRIQALAQQNIAEFAALLVKHPPRRRQRAKPILSIVDCAMASAEIAG